MRATLTDAHVRLLRGIRTVIEQDAMLAGWLDRPFAGGQDSPLAGPTSGGPALVIENFASAPWASLTFAGMRHQLDIRLSGEEAHVINAYDRLKALLDDPPMHLPGHFLAELELIDSLGEVSPDGRLDLAVRIEALTIEE